MKEITVALLAAQKEIKVAIKDAQNPHFRSSYADLPAVFDACKESLNKHGIAISQCTDIRIYGDRTTIVLVTKLMHESGQCLESVYPLIPVKEDPQGYGSAMTYARRYCLAAIVGVVADVDDDAEAACGRGPQPSRPLAAPATQVEKAPVKASGEAGTKKPIWKKGD